jgi:hypothetical protein
MQEALLPQDRVGAAKGDHLLRVKARKSVSARAQSIQPVSLSWQ